MKPSDDPVTGDKFITLDEWNGRRLAHWARVKDKLTHPEYYPNGLRCPSCDGNLYDTGQVYAGQPSYMKVKCQSCNFTGRRSE